jgi:hypothetical protein
MNVSFDCDKQIDLMAVHAAASSANLPGFLGVTLFENKLNFGFQRQGGLTKEELVLVSDIFESHKNLLRWDDIRSKRQSLFAEADWRIQRALDEGEDATQLIEYRRALRDITKQESPDTVVWPTKPW